MDSIFFWTSKLAWLVVAPDSLLLIILLSGVSLLWLGKLKWAKGVLSTVALLLLLIALFPVGEWLLYPLESKYHSRPELPQKVDGIIVLSGAESTHISRNWDSVELNGAAERDFAFIELANRYPDAKLLFSGGSGSLLNQQIKAADIARDLFISQGFDVGRIRFERESRNTYENVLFSQRLVQPKSGEQWLLITTAWHMPRSRGIFCKSGWEVIAYPVDHSTQRENLIRVDLNLSGNLDLLVVGFKEWLGILAYSLSDKMARCD